MQLVMNLIHFAIWDPCYLLECLTIIQLGENAMAGKVVLINNGAQCFTIFGTELSIVFKEQAASSATLLVRVSCIAGYALYLESAVL